MADTWAVIMAGGAGTRFWPLSRKARPKQLLPLAGERSLLGATVDRIAELVPIERVLIVTNRALEDATRAELPGLPPENVLLEPVGRNTAPCVGWASHHVARRDPGGVVMVLPADHHIADEPTFRAVLRTAAGAARSGDVVTVGIKPTRPETGYGYIELGTPISEGVLRAQRFVEKPTRDRAEQFLTSGKFLWNSGMFFFRADVVLEAIARHIPDLAAPLDRIEAAARAGEEAPAVAELFPTLPSISIDHGVMEKADRVAVVPGDFGWSDLGSWTTAWELAVKDDHGNRARPGDVHVDTTGCYVDAASGKLVALVGVSDLVIVDTDDALLVMPRERAQDVRLVVEALRARDDGRL